MMSIFSSQDDDIVNGDTSTSIDDQIKLNESKTQLAFAKYIVMGAVTTFLILTILATIFIYENDTNRLGVLVDFTTKWFSPVWAIVGGVVTYFFPSSKS
jgi:hypothetical protein